MIWVFLYRRTRKASREPRIPIETPNLNTSTAPVAPLSSKAIRSSPSIVRKRSSLAILRIMGRNGRQKESTPMSMGMTFFLWLMAVRSPMGSTTSFTTVGLGVLGIDHDTAEFAVESIRRWWLSLGKALYPGKKELLITADGGGSNGARNRLWKQQLQQFANETGLSITVAHYPPATSKWNKIEHRLFSFISINWRAKPLTSLEVVLELISHTKTKEGLEVTALKDSNSYPTGMKVSDEELVALNLSRDSFHGEWNYTIKPQEI